MRELSNNSMVWIISKGDAIHKDIGIDIGIWDIGLERDSFLVQAKDLGHRGVCVGVRGGPEQRL